MTHVLETHQRARTTRSLQHNRATANFQSTIFVRRFILVTAIMWSTNVLRNIVVSASKCHRTQISSKALASFVTSNSAFHKRDRKPGLAFQGHSPRERHFSSRKAVENDGDGFFAGSSVTFESMGVRSKVLLDRLNQLGLKQPTQIQAKTFGSIRGEDDERPTRYANDVTIGAETGSGKTLAYLLPLIDEILLEKVQGLPSYDYARAIVLVPNKELVQQVLRMAIPLCGGSIDEALVWNNSNNNNNDLAGLARESQSGVAKPSEIVRLAVLPGGLKEPMDFKPFRDSIGFGGDQPPVDIVVSTPAALGPLGLPPKFIELFEDVQTLVVDEADMLLDGGYIRSLENVLVGFRRADKIDNSMGSSRKTQHIFCAATLPDVGLKSVNAYLERKFPYATRIETDNMHNAKHYGLSQATQWYQIETKKERMERLVELLLTELKADKTMVFLNSVDDVEGVYQALEQKGVSAVPYHAKISLKERSDNLERFRKHPSEDSVPVLVCTDLASRGLDVPGVTAVVQLQFSGNVVSHLHRMGRCGRAGQKTGKGIIFYDQQEAELVAVVREAEAQQERMQLEQDVEDLDEPKGKVQNAFSRKRGFTKKRKKLRRGAYDRDDSR